MSFICRVHFIQVSHKENAGASEVEHFVAQIRLIFKPAYTNDRRPSDYLAYMQPFNPAPASIRPQLDGSRAHVPVDDIEMYKIVRSTRTDGSRRGLIVRLTDMWRPVEVVPNFGKECPKEWTASTSVELAKEFYVNSFSDKETFQNIY